MQAAWRAALALAALGWGWALPRPGAPLEPCPQPAERSARGGHTSQAGCGGGAPLRGPARLLFGLPLEANRADARSLEVLPGIGPVRARAIVAERCRRPFARLEDLRRVRGIGPRTLEAVAEWLSVEPLEPVGPAAEKPIACPEGRAAQGRGP